MSYASFHIDTTIQNLFAPEENSVPFHTDQDQEASKMIREKKYVVEGLDQESLDGCLEAQNLWPLKLMICMGLKFSRFLGTSSRKFFRM